MWVIGGGGGTGAEDEVAVMDGPVILLVRSVVVFLCGVKRGVVENSTILIERLGGVGCLVIG